MSSPTPTLLIKLQDLRPGMFVQLDLGWMDHPFPLSSFRLTSDKQIDTLRRIGLSAVKVLPDRSDPEAFADLAGQPGVPAAQREPSAAPVAAAPTPDVAAPAATVDGQQRARELRAQALKAQQTSLARCERLFAQCARQARQALVLAPEQPEQAAQEARAAVSALVAELANPADLCIRLLGDMGSERGGQHAVNVSIISLLLGRAMGLSAQDLEDLGEAALLHDLGKAMLPELVRWLSPEFSKAEARAWRDHVTLGQQLGQRMKLSTSAMQAIAQHHEHADGSGFPQQLSGERIAVPARIVALVNRYDNLCNPALAAGAKTPHEALSLLFAQEKQHFDALILTHFIRLVGVYPPGSLVQLTDDRWAMVVSVNTARPLKPRVLIHDPKVPREQALVVDLQAEPGLGVRRSVTARTLADISGAALDYLSPRPRVCYYFEPAPPLEAAAA